MKKILLICCFVLSLSILRAQTNLVPNPSFELYDTCPTNASQISYALPWRYPTTGTSDYYNSCSPASSFSFSVPTNWAGHQQARTGNGYAGFALRDGGYVEYVQVQLTDSLIAGKKYCISFYISLADTFAYSISSVGMYVSNIAPMDTNFTYLHYTPQIENPQTTFFNDTTWTEISGNYIALGGEKYITIGNFGANPYPDSLLVNSDTVHKHNGGLCCWYVNSIGDTTYYNPQATYLYIDDVSIIYCDEDAGINQIDNDFSITLYPNPLELGETFIIQCPFQNEVDHIPILKIVDIVGREVVFNYNLTKTINKYTFQVQLKDTSEGIYFITINFNNKQYTKKLIIIN